MLASVKATAALLADALVAAAAAVAASAASAQTAAAYGVVDIVVLAVDFATSAVLVVVSDADVEAYWDLIEGEYLAATYSPHFVMINSKYLPAGKCSQDSVVENSLHPAAKSSWLDLNLNWELAAVNSSGFAVV